MPMVLPLLINLTAVRKIIQGSVVIVFLNVFLISKMFTHLFLKAPNIYLIIIPRI